MRRVLSDVYGIDLLSPPSEAQYAGVIPDDFNKDVWSKYSPSKWQDIRRTYHVTQVLTPVDWTVDLPVIADNGDLRLYQIPE